MDETQGAANVEKAFGIALRRLREERGLSQEDLAALCHIHRTYVSQLERGLKSPTIRLVWQICDALESSPTVLVAEITNIMNAG